MSTCVVCLREPSSRKFAEDLCKECKAAYFADEDATSMVAWAAQRAREFERERCALTADSYLGGVDHPRDPEARVRTGIAAAIRARGKA